MASKHDNGTNKGTRNTSFWHSNMTVVSDRAKIILSDPTSSQNLGAAIHDIHHGGDGVFEVSESTAEALVQD